MQSDELFVSDNSQVSIDFVNELKLILGTDLEQVHKCIKRDITIAILNKLELELEQFNVEYPSQASICHALLYITRAKFSLEFHHKHIPGYYTNIINIILQLREKNIPDSTHSYGRVKVVLDNTKLKNKLYLKIGFICTFRIKLNTEKSMEL